MKNVRASIIAGTWYPGSEKRLRDEINLMLDITKPGKNYENILGVISPHAGYSYSGKTAAYAYNAIKDKDYETVVVIAPSHCEYFKGISVYNGDAYETPLGQLNINSEMRNKLVNSGNLIFAGDKGHSPDEHSLEIQLPFLQVVLGNFNLLPVVIGDQRRENVFELAEKLAAIKDDKTLIVVSTDLSHFHPKHEAEILDGIVRQEISQLDYEGLQRALERDTCEACGGGGVVALLKAAEILNYKKAEVLNIVDSGDVTGDNDRVVGYLSAVIYK